MKERAAFSEVKPGNQTALNTRAAPFAAFIARMHRNIHKLWGYGALEDWDDLPPNSPFNDDTLATVVEIVLNRDGSVEKVSIVKPSRYLAYDAAAIDTVYSAGPYPEPPREIRSKNGKIYVHWSFFRDARQCATSGVDYFILNNGPPGGDAGDGEDPPAPASGPWGRAVGGRSRPWSPSSCCWASPPGRAGRSAVAGNAARSARHAVRRHQSRRPR